LLLNDATGRNVWDYEQIYDKDEASKAMDDDARVWRVYNDEAERIDAEKVEGWKSTLNTMLIFVSFIPHLIIHDSTLIDIRRLVFSQP
jgi:hypothetical protein